MSAFQLQNEKRFPCSKSCIVSSPTYHAAGSIGAVIEKENRTHFAKYCKCVDPLSPFHGINDEEVELVRLKISEAAQSARRANEFTNLSNGTDALSEEHVKMFFSEQHAGKTIQWSPMSPDRLASTSVERCRKLMEKRAVQIAVSKYDDFIDRMENLTLTLVSLLRCNTFTDVGLELIKYVKTLVPNSFMIAVHQCVYEHLGAIRQYFTLEQQSSGKALPMIAKFKDFLRNWKDNRTGPLSDHFCNLVSLLTILNVVPPPSGEEGKTSGLVQKDSGHEFMLNGYRLFSAKALDVQKDAVDVVELALQTLLFFVERGYRAFESGDPSALLHTDAELVKLDHEYATLVSAIPLIESGRLSQLRDPYVDSIRDENDYCRRLDKLIKTLTDATRVTDIHPAARSSLAIKITELTKIKVKLLSAQQAKDLRVCPFAFEVFGPTGCSKSNVVTAVIKAISIANDFPMGDGTRMTMNESDKYESEMTAGTIVVSVDDMVNTKAEKLTTVPHDKIINIVNNVTRNATKADIGNKGNVPVQPKIFTVTTNVKDLSVALYSNEPASVLRRFNFFLNVRLRDTHTNDCGGFDADAFKKDRNAWSIDIEQIVVHPRENDATASRFHFRTVKEDQSLEQVMSYMAKESLIHFSAQDEYIRETESEDQNIQCSHGCIKYYCQKCNLSTENLEEQSGPSAMYCEDILVPDADPLEEPLAEKPTDRRGFFAFLFFVAFNFFEEICDFLRYQPKRTMRWYDVALPNVYGRVIRSICYWEGIHRTSSLMSRGYERCKSSLKDAFTLIYANHSRATQFGITVAAITGILVAYRMKDSIEDLFFEKTCHATVIIDSLDMIKEDEEDATSVVTVCSVEDDEKSVIPGFDDESDPGMLDAMFQLPDAGPSPTDYDNKVDHWKKAPLACRERVPDMQGATYEQMVGKIARHMHLLHNKNTGDYTNAFPLMGNFWLVPSHAYPEEKKYRVYLSKSAPETTGKHIHCEIDPSCWQRIPETDFMVLQLASAGDVPSMVHFLPVTAGETETTKCYCVSKDVKYGKEIVRGTLHEFKKDHMTKNGKFPGFIYTRGEECYQGLCMSALVPRETCPSILGFHLYGTSKKDERCIGMAGSVTRAQVENAVALFPERFKILNSGIIPEGSCGKYYGFECPIHPKHPINFMRDVEKKAPSCELIGAHQGVRSTVRSCIKETPISETVAEVFGEPNKFGPPNFKKAREHWQKDLEAMTHPCMDVSPELLNLACEDLKRKMDDVFKGEVLDQIAPLSIDAVTSGLDGIRGIDRLDLNTSAGFPLNRKKKEFAVVGERSAPGISEVVDYDPMFEEMMKFMENRYAAKERAYPIFRACMKDEALPINKDKIRLFAGGQLAFTMLVRKYFLPIVRMEHQEWKRMDGCVGINAHGPEWSDVAKKLKRFNSGKYIAGDYSKYDKKTSPMFTLAAMNAYIEVAVRSGNYTNEQIDIMRGIATDVSCPLYEYDGAFVMCFSSWVSGIPITVDGNNMKNSLYLRYAYYSILRDHGKLSGAPDFDTVVSAILYGDDNAMEVSDDAPFFHHTAVQEALARIGMKYTMADKESESVPYISFDEVSFLKRKFVWSDELGEWLAPLERDSIFKSLHNFRKNKGTNVHPEDIAAAAIDVAALEFFRHGRDSYDKDAEKLRLVVEEHDFLDNVIPSFDDHLAAYRRQYIDCEVKPTKMMYFDEQQSGCTRYEWGWEPEYDGYEPVFDQAQAGETEEAVADKETTVTFATSDPGHVHKIGAWDATRGTTDNSETSLDDFFARPVLIGTRTWDIGATNATALSPWDLFFNSPRVHNRITNYRLMRCQLHIRIVLNGNPFSSGRMLTSYAPFANADVPYSRFLIPGDAIAESQRLCLWLNPTNSTGGDMVLPFFTPQDSIDIIRGDWSQFGEITFRPINVLRNTNGNTDPITISVYAWAEQMYLDVPTSFNSAGLSPQSGESDEYGKGVVSRPASAVAHVASKLKGIPWIRPYATAAQLAGEMVAGIASHFGYSRPAIVSDLAIVDNRFSGTMSVCDTGDTSAKLTVDSKQALSIDPAIMGVDPVDELAVAPFCGVESYLTTFNVTTANNPGDLLFSIAVTPVQFSRAVPFGGTAPEIYMTPMCAMAQCFEYWFGTLDFRFMIVASNFHRMRLRFVYDPGESTPADPEYNTAFQEIVDIAELHDITFKIGWGSPFGMLQVNEPNNTNALPFSTGNVNASRDFNNGTLSVYLVTNLMNPSDVDVPVSVNVLTSASEDIKFGSATTTKLNNFSLFAPQSGPSLEYGLDTMELEAQSGIEGQAHTNPADPKGDNTVVHFSPITPNDNKGLVYMGECVPSARLLCKRYVFQKGDPIQGTTGGNDPVRWGLFQTVLIGFRGSDPNGFDTDDGGNPINFTGTPYHMWFIPFFAGWRGSIRFKCFIEGDTTGLGAPMSGVLTLTRSTQRLPTTVSVVPFPNSSEEHKEQVSIFYEESGAGIEAQPMQHKGCVEAEIPFQLNQRFIPGRVFNLSNSNVVQGYATSAIVSGNNQKKVAVSTFSAAGDDFTCGYFSGIPRLFHDT